MDSDTTAIIAGCVAGGVVLVIVLAVTIYLTCGRKKHRKKRQQSKFRQMSPSATPVHSQPSSLGHNPDARFPKVNSTGLWMGAPGMYAASPASAYYMSRGVPPTSKYAADPRLVPRASSETRLAPSGYPYVPSRQFYGSQGDLLLNKRQPAPQPPRRAVSMQRVPSQGGGQRIFHSQQLTPVFEVPIRNGGMDIYDVYQFGGVSKSKLAESKHSKSYFEDGFRLAPKLERSKSDLGDKSKHSRRTSEKSKQSSHHSRSSSNEAGSRHRSDSRESKLNSLEHGRGSRNSRSADSFKGNRAVSRDASLKSGSSGQNNRAFSADTDSRVSSSIKEEVVLRPSTLASNMKPPVPSSSVPTVAMVTTNSQPLINGTPGMVSTYVDNRNNDVSPSATDSMKLLAKNKTDDQKTIVPQTEGLMNGGENGLDDKIVGHQHYIYHGDIYAVSGNRKSLEDEEENPIISRLKDMVIEKSRSSNPSSPRDLENPPDVYISSNLSQSSQGPIYEEIKIERVDTETKEIATEKPKFTKLANPAELSILDGIELPPASDIGEYQSVELNNDATHRTNSVETGELSVPTSPVPIRVKKTSLEGGDDVDGPNEEISKAGKRITDSAFEFLNTYLSDEEGGDNPVDSPPLSPTS